MAKSVWDKIGEKINALPKQVETAFLDATEQALTEEGENLYKNLKFDQKYAMHPKGNLDAHLVDYGLKKGAITYTYEVDWSDELVRQRKGVKKERTRAVGKRDYGVAPATWRDLAYILNYGSTNASGYHAGTYFITKAMRNAKKWKKKQESKFKLNLDLLANKLKEDK